MENRRHARTIGGQLCFNVSLVPAAVHVNCFVPLILQADSFDVLHVSIVYSTVPSVPAILYQRFAAYWTPPKMLKAASLGV